MTTEPRGLVIGPGFDQWIKTHEATPLSDELYFSEEMSVIMCRLAGQDGASVTVMLFYNKLTNEIIPFVQATL